MKKLVKDAKRANGTLRGTLNIGYLSGQHISPLILATIQYMERCYPGIRSDVKHADFGALLDLLRTGSLDLVISTTFSVLEEQEFTYQEFVRLKNYVILPKDHPLAQTPQLTLSDLQNDTFLSLEKESTATITNRLNETCRECGFVPRILEAPSLDTLVLWLELGRGIAVFNEEHVACGNPQVVCRSVPEIQPITLSLIWHRNTGNMAVPLFVKSLFTGASIRELESE